MTGWLRGEIWERGGGGLAQGRSGEADVSRQDETKKGVIAFSDVQSSS